MKRGNLIVGLDVGTTKVCAIVGEVNSAGSFLSNGVDIIGIGNTSSRGLKKGVVVNIEDTAQSVKKAVEEAGNMAGIDIKAVHVGITEARINSLLSSGVIAVKKKEIEQADVERVIESAKAMPLPLHREVLHVIPTGFVVDGQNGINDPQGMTGVRLEVKAQIVTGAVTSVQNLLKSCERAGLDVVDIVFGSLASAEAVLTEDEKDVGVGVVDIGGGTTGIALFYEGNLCHTSVLTIGGNNFTNDVAIGLRTQFPEAERIKNSYGCTLLSMINPGEEIEITYVGDKPSKKVPRQHLIEILQPRAEELFSLVKEEIRKSGYYNLLVSGIVLTGGVALMDGIDTIAENILELPVRIGVPRGIGGITNIICNPMYATSVGLVLYGMNQSGSYYGTKGNMGGKNYNGGNFFNGVVNKMKTWVSGIFR